VGSLAADIGFAGLIGVIAIAALFVGSKYAPRT